MAMGGMDKQQQMQLMQSMMMAQKQQMTPQMMELVKRMQEHRQQLMKEFMDKGGHSNPQALQELMTKGAQMQAQAMAQFKAASTSSSSSAPSNALDTATAVATATASASASVGGAESIPKPMTLTPGPAKRKDKEEEEQRVLECIEKKEYGALSAVKATQYGVLERLKELVETSQCDPHQPDPENVFLLHWAAINNRLEIAKYLLALGCNVDQIGGELESTPLNWAARSGHVHMCILLMKHGANPLLFDVEGFSTLHLATMFGHSNVVAYLLVKGVDVSIFRYGKIS